MANFEFQGRSIYYEEHGQGRPLLVLNGIMMSCGSWAEFVEPFSRDNRLILLDFLEGLPGGEVFAPLYRAVRTKLRFEMPETWTMDWPENYQVSVGGESLTPEDLRRRGIGHVDSRLTKPIRSSMECTVTRRLHADGTVEIIPDYQVFSAPPIGERHMFHVYGEKAVDNRG